MTIVALILSALVIAAVVAPFLTGGERRLQSALFSNSPERLKAEKQSLVSRYLEDEQAFVKKRINKIMWVQRRQYLVNRYIDAARRLDYLNHIEREEANH